jgi:hypothetical protein
MSGFQLIGVFALIPTTVLLTISFFVLFTLRKVDLEGLKAFGYVVAALLWISAAIIFGAGVYTMATGRHPMIPMMQQMMKGQMGQPPMMQHQMMNR